MISFLDLLQGILLGLDFLLARRNQRVFDLCSPVEIALPLAKLLLCSELFNLSFQLLDAIDGLLLVRPLQMKGIVLSAQVCKVLSSL